VVQLERSDQSARKAGGAQLQRRPGKENRSDGRRMMVDCERRGISVKAAKWCSTKDVGSGTVNAGSGEWERERNGGCRCLR
jgi:hypothetical protein